MRLNIDTPQIQDNELPTEINKWMANIVDQLNYNLNNIIANSTANIGGAGAGPLTINVRGLTVDSVVLATIKSSTNPVSVQKVTAGTNSFDVLLSGDPGASCVLNYIVFIAPWIAQGA